MSTRQMTVIRTVNPHDTGGVIELHKGEPHAVSADVGLPVRITIKVGDDNYEATLESARRVRRGRSARTHELLAK